MDDDGHGRAEEPPSVLWREGLAPDFGPVERVVVVWDDDLAEYQAQVMIGAWGAAELSLVHHPADDVSGFLDVLDEAGFDSHQVRLEPMNVMGPWVRDYAPLVVRRLEGSVAALDFRYLGGAEDDAAGADLARFLGPDVTITSLDVALDGGNWLSDGDGRCVATEVFLLNNNMSSAEGRDFASEWLGCRDIVFLSVLYGEPTGHVDMFVHLYGAGRALVGQYSRDVDPINAGLLDEAALRLEHHGFTVRRVPMPARLDGQWRTHLNATVVNEVVLVPVYGDDRRVERQAVAAFEQVYPGRTIRPIESSWVIKREGAVHCTTITVPRLR